MSPAVPLVESAPAKVNLTLRVLRRRADGYHEIESLVAFADFGDRLTLAPGVAASLTVRGPGAAQAGDGPDNLVLKAARQLAARVPDIGLGAFELDKVLPVAAGLGGGSADAAAALRLIARTNGLKANDPRLFEAARATSADVSVCLDPQPRVMRGIGEVLSEPVDLPTLPALLVNPRVALPTKPVFAGWSPPTAHPPLLNMERLAKLARTGELVDILTAQSNDLETPAIALAPVIADVLVALSALRGCRLARMSGSGATCFALFRDRAEATAASKILGGKHPHWWVQACTLGSAG